MDDCNLHGLIKTIQEDRNKVLSEFRGQDPHKAYTAHEVVSILELIFALVETSITTEIEKLKNSNQETDGSYQKVSNSD